MKALPAGTPAGIAKPAPSPSASRPPQAGEEGSIRIAPSGTRDSEALATAQLAVADGFFGRKEPGSAVAEYEKFLIMATKATPGRDRAVYRLGESQRLMGSTVAAEATFRRLLEENPAGEFTPSASFRLGEIEEERGDASGAAGHFAFTAKEASDPSIRETARYREALCLKKAGRYEQAENLLKGMAEAPASSPRRTLALFQLASQYTKDGRREEALSCYTRILDSGEGAVTGEARSEAGVKAALLQSELGRAGEARQLFDRVASSKESGRWGGVAALGALRIAAREGDDAGVLRIAEAALASDSENKPEILLIRANALRRQGKNARALEEYDVIIREFPASDAASAAPFQRLLALHALRSPSLPEEIDRYLMTASDPADRARAQFLKAEETLRGGKYADAAALYRAIPPDSLPPDSRPDILYKEAWSLTQAGETESAVEAIGRFLEKYPDDERAPSALAQRATLRQRRNDLSGAVADFLLLEERHPKAPERELALQQRALLLGQQQDNKGMAETFAMLLRDYPKSSAASQAHYWIGWTAMENKDYALAVEEFSKSRAGDPKQFGERAGLRILLAEYYMNHPAEAAREAAAIKPGLIPPEVGRWLGVKAMESGDPAGAERFLSPLAKEGLPGASDPEIQSMLASALVAQGKSREAQCPAASCLRLARDPASRARALIVAATIQRTMKNFKEAAAMAEEAMLLQPEGTINAEARVLSGDILFSQQDHAGAAKAYMTVVVLHDDPVVTPKALAKAVDAYRRAGNPAEAQKALEELRKRFPNVPLPPMPKP